MLRVEHACGTGTNRRHNRQRYRDDSGGFASNGVVFVVGSIPTITQLSTNVGNVGTPITITGTNFGSTQGTSTVTFNGDCRYTDRLGFYQHRSSSAFRGHDRTRCGHPWWVVLQLTSLMEQQTWVSSSGVVTGCPTCAAAASTPQACN